MVAAPQQAPDEFVMRAAALDYAQRGWRVFPLAPNTKVPLIPKKRGGNGCLDATVDRSTITEWWTRYRSANIGWAMGEGFVAIDEDLYKGADLTAWRLPPTLQSRSARGGLHHIYRYDSAPLDCVPEGLLAPGVCVRGVGGYIVAPPSRVQTADGFRFYEFVDPHQPMVELPERIAALIRASGQEPEAQSGKQAKPAKPRPARPSQPQSGQYWLDWAMGKTGMGRGDLVGLLLAQQLLVNRVPEVDDTLLAYARQASLNPRDPFTVRDAARWKRSAEQSRIVQRGEAARSQRAAPAVTDRPHREKKAPESAKSEPNPAKSVTDRAESVTDSTQLDTEQPEKRPVEHRTDMGNARRFVARFGAEARYVALWKQWLIWDGRRWRHDDTDGAVRLAKQTVRGIYAEASACEDDTERSELVKWAMKSEAHNRVQALLTQAQSEPEIALTPAAFDAHPWLLNVQNGTIDLKTGRLRAHRREDYLTQLAPDDYVPGARFERWDEYLESATGGDATMRDFLQRAVGYTLTGDTSEEKLFFLHGPTRVGKSTFLEAIKAMLGDYARTADFESFIAKKNAGGPRDDIADLVGGRMVCSAEVEEGKKLAEGLVKSLTGGEFIKARHLYSKGFEFLPQFKLWLAANNEPRVDASDGAMWNRILRIPFDHPPEKKDKNLKHVLRTSSQARSAILAWALDGCLAWQRDGLGVPPIIEAATNDYRAEMDPLKVFLEERCVIGSNYFVTITRLWEAYEEWARNTKERWPLSQRKFKNALDSSYSYAFSYGVLRRVHGVPTRCCSGLALASDVESVTETKLWP